MKPDPYPTFSLVRVPFPFTDRTTAKRRPALVVWAPRCQTNSGYFMLAMVNSATHSNWHLDWAIQELEVTGLPKPCMVRLKLFSLDERLILNGLGALANSDRNGVAECLRQLLPLQ